MSYEIWQELRIMRICGINNYCSEYTAIYSSLNSMYELPAALEMTSCMFLSLARNGFPIRSCLLIIIKNYFRLSSTCLMLTCRRVTYCIFLILRFLLTQNRSHYMESIPMSAVKPDWSLWRGRQLSISISHNSSWSRVWAY